MASLKSSQGPRPRDSHSRRASGSMAFHVDRVVRLPDPGALLDRTQRAARAAQVRRAVLNRRPRPAALAPLLARVADVLRALPAQDFRGFARAAVVDAGRNQGSAAPHAFGVESRFLFGDADIDQGAGQPADRGADSGPGKRRQQRPGGQHRTHARDGQRRQAGDQAHAAADRGAGGHARSHVLAGRSDAAALLPVVAGNDADLAPRESGILQVPDRILRLRSVGKQSDNCLRHL
jgi:hypothetical protein